MSAIGERIRCYRKFIGWTQEQLAHKTGLSVMSIRRYESGDRMPNQIVIAKIAQALEISPSFLLDEVYDCDVKKLGYELSSAARKQVVTSEEFRKLYAEFKEKSEKYGIPPEAKKYVQFLRQLGYLPNEDAEVNAQNVIPKLLQAVEKLNDDGKIIAVQRIEELAEIPSYQAKPAAKPVDIAPEGKDTPKE